MAEPHATSDDTKYIVSSGDIRPVPDPTLLTSTLVAASRDELRREIHFIQQIMEGKIEAVLNIFQTRLDESDKAIVLLRAMQDRLPEKIVAQVAALQQLMEQRFITQQERFSGIQGQFSERDTRTEQIAQGNEKAINAALAAAKEAFQEQNRSQALAIAKSEAATMKSIDQLTALFQTAIAALSEQLGDLKERVLLIEGRTAGLSSAANTQRVVQSSEQASSSHMLGIIGLIAATLLGIASIIVAIILKG